MFEQRRPAETWDVIGPEPMPAHMQMAVDEALLDAVVAGRRGPTLRFWDWAERALVLGSHQSVANEVDVPEAARLGFTITRRMSGGGTMIVEPGRTITYSIYAPAALVEGLSFVESFRFLDAWAVAALRELGIDAAYRPINDIVSPRGKIGGAAQARRRGALLHHTTIAHSMDVDLVRRLIRLGRPPVSSIGLRSAEKEVSPLAWFTGLGVGEVRSSMAASFRKAAASRASKVSREEAAAAERLLELKYSRPAWVHRLP